MRIKNKHISADEDTILRLAEEYFQSGFRVEIPEPTKLIVIARPEKKQRKRKVQYHEDYMFQELQ